MSFHVRKRALATRTDSISYSILESCVVSFVSVRALRFLFQRFAITVSRFFCPLQTFFEFCDFGFRIMLMVAPWAIEPFSRIFLAAFIKVASYRKYYSTLAAMLGAEPSIYRKSCFSHHSSSSVAKVVKYSKTNTCHKFRTPLLFAIHRQKYLRTYCGDEKTFQFLIRISPL